MKRRVIVMRSVTMIAAAAISWPWAGPASAVARGDAVGGTFAEVSSVSCPSAGNCAAVGELFTNSPGINKVFVVNETQGVWGREQQVKGLAALPKGGATGASLTSVSCSSPGNCAAVGSYFDHVGSHPLIVNETNGTWGIAKTVALPKPDPFVYPGLDLVTCQATGDCTATGDNGQILPFVVSEHHGSWGKAEQVPGIASLGTRGGGVDALACASAGNCAVGGLYDDSQGNKQAFVAAEANGTWGRAREVPGIATANKGGEAATESVSCPAPRKCLAVGFYLDSGGNIHPFISSQENGIWHHIQPVPGLASLPGTNAGEPELQWDWCASPGNCTAVGDYVASDGMHGFDVTEKGGTWGEARKIRLGARTRIKIMAVSCVSIGNCSAGGWFTGVRSQEVFVITETNGVWGAAHEVPGSVALNRGGFANLYSISCGAPGQCTAGGVYSPKSRSEEPFLVTEKDGVWGNAMRVKGLP